jgi:membrane protease YdiL (CAAX protease family)
MMEYDRQDDEQPIPEYRAPASPEGTGYEMPPIRFGFLAGLGVTMFSMLGALILALPFKSADNSVLFRMVLGISQLGLLLLPTLYLARAQSLPFRELFRLRRVPLLTYPVMLIGIVSILLVAQCYQIAQEVFLIPPEWKHAYFQMDRQTEQSMMQMFSSHSLWGLTLSLLVGALSPAVSEEFLFRGLVQRSFERRLRPGLAIGLAGAIFGMVHFQPTNLVVLASLGMFFGYTAWSMGSIYPTIFAHAIFNAFAIIQFSVTGEAAGDRTGRFTPADFYELLPLALLSLGLFLMVIYWIRHQRIERLTASVESIELQEPAPSTSSSSSND